MISPTTVSTTKILLLGAGELGTAFLKHLSVIPSTCVAFAVRTPEKYQHLISSNVSAQRLDLSGPSSELAAVFSTFDILISATGFGASPSSVLKLTEEALMAGSLKAARGEGQLWFFPWQWGVDYDVTLDSDGLMPLFGAQKAVRDLLRERAVESNLKWSVVSTGIFMSFLFEQFWGIVDRTQEQDTGTVLVRCLKDWEHKITVTDVDDIGRVVSRIITSDIDANNKVVFVAGDTVSYTELARIIEQASGKEVQKEQWDIPHLARELANDTGNGIKRYRLVFAGAGVWWEKQNTANYALVMDMTNVRQYAARLFRGSN